jgi:hypothetical protein
MASLSRSEALIQLGKRLVAELEDKGDLTAAWIAHMIAERMSAAETAAPDNKPAADEACQKAILELWHHQDVLSRRLRPFLNMEPVMRALGSLDLADNAYRYAAEALREADRTVDQDGPRQWINLAVGLDRSARFLIRYALWAAAAEAAEDVAPWVALAREAGAVEPMAALVVSFLLETGEKLHADPEGDALKERVDHLQRFVKAADLLLEELRERLANHDGEAQQVNRRSEES